MNNKVYSASLKGLRPSQEDSHKIITNLDGTNPDMKSVNLYLVADGHGGPQVSAYVAENLPKFFCDKRVEYPLSKKYVYNVSDFIQKSLSTKPYYRHTGSTMTMAIHFKLNGEDYLNVINVGDSRIILCRDGLAIPLTKDHKPNAPDEVRRINSLGGHIKWDGFEYRIKDLSVSRAFGDADSAPYVSHRGDIYRYKIDKNDKFMVLACDGAYDVLQNHEITNFILNLCYDQTLTKRINKNINVSQKLAEYALKRKSSDNISIITVFFD